MADDLDALYAADLDDFVAARNALAKRLRAEGEREAAAEVAALRKPSVVVWTANQLARAEAEEVGGLVDAAEAMRGALARGDTEAYDRARRAHRDASATLREAAARLLRERRGSAGVQTLDRVERLLAAASVEPGAAGRLRAGRLEEEVEPAGFGALGPIAPAPARRPGPDVAELRAALRRAEERERETASEAQATEREARQARRRAAELEREAAEAAEAAERAAAARAEAEERLREARE